MIFPLRLCGAWLMGLIVSIEGGGGWLVGQHGQRKKVTPLFAQ
jgi:hypothetical protein